MGFGVFLRVLLFTKTTTKYRNYYEIPELPKLLCSYMLCYVAKPEQRYMSMIQLYG